MAAHLRRPEGPFKVLVIGGCYAGISACLNLLDLCSGRDPRCGKRVDDSPASLAPIEVEVTIVDERDGYCKSLSNISFGRIRKGT